MNIPKEAVEAMCCIPLETEEEDDFAFLAPSQAAGLIQAALPALLADYRARLEQASAELDQMRTADQVSDSYDPLRRQIRLDGKAEGVRLALSYLDEMTR